MKTSKITTYWTADQAITICEFLDEIRAAILTSHATEIEHLNKGYRKAQLEKQQAVMKIETDDWFDDNIPF